MDGLPSMNEFFFGGEAGCGWEVQKMLVFGGGNSKIFGIFSPDPLGKRFPI